MTGTILKLQTPVDIHDSREGVKINKLLSSISPTDFIRLLKRADNKVNPRTAKKNQITESIHETLEMSPELFWFKTKGILLATENLTMLERNRINITLSDLDYEGIMDGGHNTFAIASFLTEKLYGKKFRTWDECKTYWRQNEDTIAADFEARATELPRFSVPIEIIFPKDEDGALDQFRDYIAEICSARNNNVQLSETSKGNKVGLYDDLKEILADFDVIWKSGEQGKIKSEDVISLATIPLLYLQEQGLLPDEVNQLNPVSVYSYKSKCIDFYNSVLSHEGVSSRSQGKHELADTYIKSGLSLVSDILPFFDRLYAEFPNLYNRVSPGFGRIKSVDDKKGKQSLFRTSHSEYNYPPGFVYPLITGVTELIEIHAPTNTLRWKISPTSIDLNDLDMVQYVNAIKLANYDPQTVGKQPLFYQQAKSIFESYLAKR